MIYQFSEQGVEKESIQELERYIQNLQENKVDELIQHKMNASDKFGLFPILISLFFSDRICWCHFHALHDECDRCIKYHA
ncbi:hypothetical protein OL548_19885 [Lysinibacillus sp. MHQ-1]|nr:hypothetical protein OL548_19885 [Lysinibacillus sp. MHQ-1]